MTVTGPLTLGGAVRDQRGRDGQRRSASPATPRSTGRLVNRGTAIWSAGNFTGSNGAVFTNALGAIFINSFDGNAPSGGGTTPLWINGGIFQKTNGTAALGTTSIDFSSSTPAPWKCKPTHCATLLTSNRPVSLFSTGAVCQRKTPSRSNSWAAASWALAPLRWRTP